jgi:hypothetical protein
MSAPFYTNTLFSTITMLAKSGGVYRRIRIDHFALRAPRAAFF